MNLGMISLQKKEETRSLQSSPWAHPSLLSPSFLGVTAWREDVWWDLGFPKAKIGVSGPEVGQVPSGAGGKGRRRDGWHSEVSVFETVCFGLMEQVWGWYRVVKYLIKVKI